MDNVKIIDNTEQSKKEYGYMWGSRYLLFDKRND